MITDGVMYQSWDSAVRVCRDGGYHSNDLARVVAKKNLIFRQKHSENRNCVLDVPLVNLALSCLMNGRDFFSCLDFGGGGGMHEYLARRNSSVRNLRWAVVETTEMCKYSRSLETENLRWFDNMESACSWLGNINLILSSSVLQYIEDPLRQIDGFVNLRSDYILVTRTPLSELDMPVISIQKSKLSENGPGPLPREFQDCEIRYPIAFTPLVSFLSRFEGRYDSKIIYLESRGSIKVSNSVINNFYTVFFKRRN
jgi:putative methyltransferase (TIGR04325 family)